LASQALEIARKDVDMLFARDRKIQQVLKTQEADKTRALENDQQKAVKQLQKEIKKLETEQGELRGSSARHQETVNQLRDKVASLTREGQMFTDMGKEVAAEATTRQIERAQGKLDTELLTVEKRQKELNEVQDELRRRRTLLAKVRQGDVDAFYEVPRHQEQAEDEAPQDQMEGSSSRPAP
jgi:predicted RNase H-like nuclease (RuvC/YqgF family)